MPKVNGDCCDFVEWSNAGDQILDPPNDLVKGLVMKGATINYVPPLQHLTRTAFTVVNPIPSYTYQVAVHAACLCNELRGLTCRHLVHDGRVPKRPVVDLYTNERIREFVTFLGVEKPSKMKSLEFVKQYTGRKYRIYYATYMNSRIVRHYRQDAIIKSFPKIDKIPRCDICEKDARMIQYRAPRMNLAVGVHLKPLEENYYKVTDFTNQRMVAKGLNNLQRAQALVEAAKAFECPIFVLADHSKFDAHVTPTMLKAIHKMYDLIYCSKRLRSLLRYQLDNRCFSKSGIRYSVKGTRMSGDYDTALGNTMLNHFLIHQVFKHVKYHPFIDGDDSVIIIEKGSLSSIDFELFRQGGMITEVQVVEELNQIEFCRSRLMASLDPPRFARNPKRALSNMSVSLKDYHGKDAWRRVMAGVGLGELAVSAGVPILQPAALAFAALHDKPIFPDDYGQRGKYDQIPPITHEARMEFYAIYGVSPQEQIEIESLYTTPILTLGQPAIANVEKYFAQESQP